MQGDFTSTNHDGLSGNIISRQILALLIAPLHSNIINDKEKDMSTFGEVNDKASELYNALSDEDRHDKAGLGYSLAQHTTIIQIRMINKKAWQDQDRELARWQKNIEMIIKHDYIDPSGQR